MRKCVWNLFVAICVLLMSIPTVAWADEPTEAMPETAEVMSEGRNNIEAAEVRSTSDEAVLLADDAELLSATSTVQITYSGQVVDTFNGVSAKYIPGTGNSNTGSYSCAGYVHTYYSTIYGITVSNLLTGKTPNASNGSFSVTSSPEPGDIGYQLNSRDSGHWFIIKEVNGDGSYTIIEQNWKWESSGATYCNVNRHVSYSATKGFKVFRWSGKPSPTPPANHNPIIHLDSADSPSPGKVHVVGWAYDPDDKSAQLDIHVYAWSSDNQPSGLGIIQANIPRGEHHAFEATLSTDISGEYMIRCAAINVGEGENSWSEEGWTVNIAVNHSPIIHLEKADSPSPGKVHVLGWAYDPDDKSAQLDIHAYAWDSANQPSGLGVIKANISHDGIDETYHCGKLHGFEATLPTNISGEYMIRCAAINVGEGENSWSEEGWTVTIQKDTEAPKVTAASLSNISGNKCTFSITATDNVKVDHVDFHVWCDTWTQSGETVYQAKQSGNNWSYDIPLNLSNGKKWLMDARVYDLSGNQTLSSGNTVPGALLRFYTITFNANGGSCSTANKQVIGARYWLRGQVGDTYVCTYGDLPTPTRDGYAFDGWYTESNGGSKITKDSKVTIAENQTLYAHWKDTQSPVITQISGPYDLSPNGYTFKITATDTAGVAKVRALSWVDPVENAVKTWTDATKSGNEWTVSVQRNGENNGNSSAWRTDLYAYDAAENASLCKQILLYYCTVTFDANGGDCATANKAVFRGGYLTNYTDSVDFHLKYGDLPTPTRSGYTFDGWYTALEDGEQVTAESEVAVRTNHTLYAHWSVNVEITKVVPHNLSPNGYTLNVTTSDAVSSVRALSWVDPAETAEKIWDDATKSGSEWIVSVKRNGENNDGLPWRTNLYAYDGAGNSSLPENILIYYYTVSFNANGGVCDTNRKEIFSGSHLTDWANSRDFNLKYGDLPVPTRDGYAFDGWYTDADAGEKVTEESKVTATKNHALYAHWTKKPAPPDSSALQIIVGSVSASKGSVVDIPVTIKNNPGISGATLAVSYDKSVLTLTSITKGAVFENGSYTSYPENGVVQWYHTENVTGDGVLFTFQFTVDGNAQNGNYNIAVGLRDGIPANLSNADSNIVNAQFISGVLEITSGIRGDVTGDGVVAINDVVKVARAVAGSLTLTEAERTVADVTGEGVIAINDVVKLARYIAGSIATLQSAEASSLSSGESAVIEVATVSGKPGEAVRVPVSITSNPGIAGLQLDVRFDNGLTLKNVVQGDILSGENFTPDVSAGRIQWYYEQANVTNTGVLFTLEFEIGAEAQNGDAYAVTVNVKDGISANLSDYDSNPVNAEFKPGKIQISETADNTAITTVSRNGNTITANVVCADSNATVFCAVYNNSGKMIAVRSAQITGESSYQFQFDGQQFDYAKAFIVDSDLRPLCESKRS